ncbi:MAG TPA: hypothetical protein VK656_04930 [Candidatus Acidoferrum sp.]|nr:hypothetical protein [Candidatus Acidoferrum sp.]
MDQPPATPPEGSGPPPGPQPSSGWSASSPGEAPVPPAPAASDWSTPGAPVPPTAPGWAAPTQPSAPVGWAPPPVAPIGRQSTTGFAKTAAILLIAFGMLLGLFGLVFIAAGAAAGTIDQSFLVGVSAATLRDFVAGVGIVVLVFAVIQILGGIGSWRGSGWGRVIGLVYGVLGTLLGLSALGSPARQGAGSGLLILAVYGFITLALAFRWKSPAR